MEDIYISLFTKEEVVEIFKVLNFKELNPLITDFAILLGGNANVIDRSNSQDIKLICPQWWTQDTEYPSYVTCASANGFKRLGYMFREAGIRPVLHYSQIKASCTNKRTLDKVTKVDFGMQPDKVVNIEIQNELENLYKYKSNELEKVSFYFPVDKNNSKYDDWPTIAFELEILDEFYKYNGKIYLRMLNRCKGFDEPLSNGRNTRDVGNYVWLEVNPITWIVNEEKDICFTEKIGMSGIQFNNVDSDILDFLFSDMYNYLKKYYLPAITQTLDLSKVKSVENTYENYNKNLNINPYNFNYENVSEEDIMKSCIQSGITPYLHGRSSEGKSARVKQLDKDCEIIYLANASIESLLGKSVYIQPTYKRVEVPVKKKIINELGNEEEKEFIEYQDVIVEEGHMLDIKPSWLENLEEKCKSEPDKIHILFLDELANALPAIQKLAFNLILDKEVNGKWKLPENARIVAAGNEVEDSISANELAEPLFNRLAHVYIKTTAEDWLKWAITPESEYEKLDVEESKVGMKIHPAIYAFISFKRDKGLRTKYNGQTPNADPRKWEMASKILYQTGNPKMLRSLIGEELTTEFVAFTKKKVITLEDVINGNYNEQAFNLDIGEKYATIVSLSYVDEDNLEKVRNFVEKLGDESLATFDSLWAKGDSSRLEHIAELRMRNYYRK